MGTDYFASRPVDILHDEHNFMFPNALFMIPGRLVRAFCEDRRVDGVVAVERHGSGAPQLLVARCMCSKKFSFFFCVLKPPGRL